MQQYIVLRSIALHKFTSMNEDFLKKWDTQLKKGILPLLVLHILAPEPRYGYDLIQRLKSDSGIEITESTMYPLLVRLHEEGLLTHRWVEQASGIPRKYYELTPAGRDALAKMTSSLTQIARLF